MRPPPWVHLCCPCPLYPRTSYALAGPSHPIPELHEPGAGQPICVALHCTAFIHQASNVIVEVIRLLRHDCPFVNPYLLFPVCLERFSTFICSIIYPRTQVKSTGFQFPRSSFLPFMKIGVIFALSQSLGISPSHHGLSKIVESGLAMTSVSSFDFYG